MGKKSLTKKEARALIAPIIDGEAAAEERAAFMNYIRRNEDVRREYESMKKVKNLIVNRCPCAKAPDSLRNFLSTVSSAQSPVEKSAPIYDIPSGNTVGQHSKSSSPNSSDQPTTIWYYAAAAVLLLTAILWSGIFWDSTSDGPMYNVEEYAYEHFMKYDGKLVPPTISTASLGTAESRIEQDYDMKMTIPELKNAEFKGVVYDEFVPNYNAPMLEYYLPSGDQYIYIFAFNIDQMDEFGQLVRDKEAVKSCKKPKDFHVRQVNGKHIVSWKWNNVWYAAVSNHDGNTVASLVEPLAANP